mmetsp:Transcript_64332/g.126567  ORF Transcript_64332/g.126567 Transcript_64332/m.126567 type:complete len:219 (-) Transcript_64332:80-736(-)
MRGVALEDVVETSPKKARCPGHEAVGLQVHRPRVQISYTPHAAIGVRGPARADQKAAAVRLRHVAVVVAHDVTHSLTDKTTVIETQTFEEARHVHAGTAAQVLAVPMPKHVNMVRKLRGEVLASFLESAFLALEAMRTGVAQETDVPDDVVEEEVLGIGELRPVRFRELSSQHAGGVLSIPLLVALGQLVLGQTHLWGKHPEVVVARDGEQECILRPS